MRLAAGGAARVAEARAWGAPPTLANLRRGRTVTAMAPTISCPSADLPAVLPPGDQGYVAGFLLDDRDRVVLVRKLRPAWQAGLLNGVGGKIEAGEAPAEAMRREFREEACLDLDGWELFAHLTFPGGAVWFFRLRAAPAVLDAVTAGTDEPIEVHPVTAVLDPATPTLPNLRWILPLGTHTRERYAPVCVHQY